mgnify:CR=1 FL=1
MANSKLSKKDIEKVMPPKDREDAIKQTEKYVTEFENSKREFEELIKKLSRVYDEV